MVDSIGERTIQIEISLERDPISIGESDNAVYLKAVCDAGGDLKREADLLFDFSGGHELEKFRREWVQTRKNKMNEQLAACVNRDKNFYDKVFRLARGADFGEKFEAEGDIAFNTILSLNLGAKECERAAFKRYWVEEKRSAVTAEIKANKSFDIREGCLLYVITELVILVFVICRYSLMISVLSVLAFLIGAVLPAIFLFSSKKK